MLGESNSNREEHVKCPFTLKHYSEILEIAKSNGYVFLGFHDPSPPKGKIIYLRHDIDVCLEEALDMATVEAELGIRSVYFVLVNSPLYNLLAADSIELISQIQEKGHWIGLHFDPVLLTSSSDEGLLEREVQKFLEFFRNKFNLVPVVSFHRPIPEVLGKDFQSFVSTYSRRFFSDIKYISDSRGIWREGCPCKVLKEQTYMALQMLVHPIWWKRSESESLNERLYTLLGERLKQSRTYLAANIEPLVNLLRGEVVE